MITRVYDNMVDYEVGKDNVVSIEPSNQGPKSLNMYKITFVDGGHLFLGLTEHEVVRNG